MDTSPLQSRPIGTTGLEVTELGLGTAPLASIFWGNEEQTAVATAQRAMDLGIRLFDTAPLYGLGESEQRLGQALHGRTDLSDAVVTTKVGNTVVEARSGDRDLVADYSRDGVHRQLEASLQRLGRDAVDIVHVHDPEDHLDQAIDECFVALAELRDQGVVRAISVGTNFTDTAVTFLERADPDLVMVAGRLSLLDRSANDRLIPELTRRGVPMLAAGVFNSGVLARPVEGAWFNYSPVPDEVLERVRAMQAVCREAGVSLQAAALQFALRCAPVAAVVVGMACPAEVDQNLELFQAEIADEVWSALEAL